MFQMEDSDKTLEDQDPILLEVLDPTFLMEDSDPMLEVLDPMLDHSMKVQGKMEEDKLVLTMEVLVLMQQDLRAILLEEDQVDHSMQGDPQETPMEGGLME